MAAADPIPLTAAIIHAPNESVDDMLSSFVQQLAGKGVRVEGLLQKLHRTAPGGACAVDLVDITTGKTYPIFQDLGSGSTACRLDPAGVVASSIVLRRAIEARADLIVVNRFGSMEREGRGLAQEMLAAMAEQLPVLTVVAERYAADWESFTGGLASRLPASPEALRAWFDGIAASGPDVRRSGAAGCDAFPLGRQ